jgi:prephenate dehydratase
MVNNKRQLNGGSRPVSSAQVKQMIQARKEKHILSLDASGTSTTGGTITYLSQIAEGDGADDRAGYEVRPVKHLVHLEVENGSTSMTRFIILQDKNSYGSSPSVGQILSSIAPTTTINPSAVMNGRFKILLDTMMTTSGNGNQIAYKTFQKRMGGSIHFIGSGSTSASAGANSMFLLVISNVATTYKTHHQLTFTDT